MTMAWHRATILSRRQLSPTVTGLTLIIDPPANGGADFAFLPGQWVDFRPLPSSASTHAAGGKIGGYSLTSVPQGLPHIELAIQRSRHPVAEWATARARPHDAVDVRVGGSFTYARDRLGAAPGTERLLFCAGGVGINPLLSMIRQWHLDQTTRQGGKSRAVLLYSGRAREELLFTDELATLMNETPDRFRVTCTTTKGQCTSDEAKDSLQITGDSGRSDIVFREGRIDSKMIGEAISWLNRSDSSASDTVEPTAPSQDDDMRERGNINNADAVFVCGPPGMPESMMKILSDEKQVQSTNNVHYEKWW